MPTVDECIGAARLRARMDPAVFASFVLGVTALPDLHCDIHEHTEAHPDCAIELPRGHGKTTEIAIGRLHRIARTAIENPTLPIRRLKVVVANDDEAKKSGRFLREIVESEPWRFVFPELVIDDSWRNLSDFRIINRASKATQPLRDPTVECRSIMGRPGGRWDDIWFDDICDLQTSIIKPAMRPQVMQAVANTWMPMRDKGSPHTPSSVRTYTPWHTDDQGSEWRRYHEQRGSLLRRPVVDFRSPWPEVFTPEYLRDYRDEVGSIAYARSMELVPVSTAQLVFRPEWMSSRFWTEIPEGERAQSEMVIALDFAFTAKSAQKPNPDYSVCHFARIGNRGAVWLVETVRGQWTYPDFMRAIKERQAVHRPVRGIGEAVAGQAGLVQQAEIELGIPFDAKPRVRDKHTRASACQSQVEAGDLRMRQGSEPGQPTADQQPAFEEMCAFPAGSHDDCMDPILDLLDDARLRRVYGASQANTPALVRMAGAGDWSQPGGLGFSRNGW